MKYKTSKYRAKQSHRYAGSKQKLKFQAKEVNNIYMNEDKFRNFSSEDEQIGDQSEVKPQFRHRREELRAKAFGKAHRARFCRKQRLNMRNRAIHQKDLPIHRRHVRTQHRRHNWPTAISYYGLLHERRYLQRRIRHLKMRLHYLTWQVDSMKGQERGYRSRISNFRQSHAEQRPRRHSC